MIKFALGDRSAVSWVTYLTRFCCDAHTLAMLSSVYVILDAYPRRTIGIRESETPMNGMTDPLSVTRPRLATESARVGCPEHKSRRNRQSVGTLALRC